MNGRPPHLGQALPAAYSILRTNNDAPPKPTVLQTTQHESDISANDGAEKAPISLTQMVDNPVARNVRSTIADLALVGVALIPMAGPGVAGAFQAGRNYRTRKVELYRDELLSRLVDDLSRRVDDLEEAMANPQRIDLVMRGSELAATTAGDETIRLIADFVAEGLLPESTSEHLSRAQLLLDVVAQLHPDHLQVLRQFDPNVIVHGGWRDGAGGNPMSEALLSQRLRGFEGFIGPLLARLTALGLIEELLQPTPPIPVPGNTGPREWALTRFGVELVRFMDARPG